MFDKFLRLLDRGELMTCMCIVRRTVGEAIESAPISLTDFMETTQLSKSTQIKSLRQLVGFGIVVQVSPSKPNQAAWWSFQSDEDEIDWGALWERHDQRAISARERTNLARNMSMHSRGITIYPSLPTPRRGGMAGYVYVMLIANGRYKVGFSRNPVARSRNLGMDLVYWVVVDDMKEAEKSLHNIFHAYHIKNELFSLTESALAFVLSLRAYVNGAWRTAK
ncbi:MAG: GIY-YIG nuclease family protein [Anaerolineae bacterium]|nr:GIY-YIG nuclease family protein [Anaerolineae bacterium]